MASVDRVIREGGFFLRRRELLALGFTDSDLHAALSLGRIFRVRQGWYSVSDAPEVGIRAVRVGGRLTSISALESYGLPVPRSALMHVAVPPTASRLRSASDRRLRLSALGAVVVHWNDARASPDRWRVGPADALFAVLQTESRDVAVACCGAALKHRLLTPRELAATFARAPLRVHKWSTLVSGLDESHGETFYRLWMGDAGLACEQQVVIAGVGRIDFRMSSHVYVEIDGGQHDPAWTGGSASSWQNDLDRDAAMTIRGDRVLHFGYRQLYSDFAQVIAAVEHAVADDAALVARRRRHPYRPLASRKRRRSVSDPPTS